MSDNNIKTVYTQDEVKAMMRACLKGINASNGFYSDPYIDIERIYHTIDDVQDMFSQILRILNAEYNEICKAFEAAEREEQEEKRPVKVEPFH